VTLDGFTVQSLNPSSPLGSALMGLSVGDEAEVESPQGVRVYEIVSLR
jgi:transcription elongation GreA/GreB family factor